MAFENNEYYGADVDVVAGKDIVLAIFDITGTNLLAVNGQQGLTINHSADSIEVTSKDTKGGYKSKITGMKEWSIDTDGFYIPSSLSHKALGSIFKSNGYVCVKVIDMKKEVAMFGGKAVITDYSLEAPYDDAMTYSLSLEGSGELYDLADNPDADQMPGEVVNAALIAATAAVVAAETAKTQASKDSALLLVAGLVNGAEKTALLNRIIAIVEA